MKQINFSIILPCYNELDNLPQLLANYKKIINTDDTELIIVNNGSTDNTSEFMTNYMQENDFVQTIILNINQGYGYGIMQGLLKASGEWIGWSHADLQTDATDVINAIDYCRTLKKEDRYYIKGKRQQRNIFAYFFSRGLDLCAKLILKVKLYEINAQPNFFNKGLLTHIKNPPYNWEFDLYCYYIATKMNYTFLRIPVFFHERKHGKSKWNINLFSRFSLALQNIKYCLLLKKIK